MSKYRFSFIGASMLYSESIKIAEQYQQLRDWNAVKQVVMDENLLQKNKLVTAKREYIELENRLKYLSDTQIDYFLQTNPDEQRLLLFWTICQYYQIIADFTLEVVRHKVLGLEHHLEEADYNWFLEGKINNHPEIEKLTDSTQKKVRSTLFLILAEAGLINNTKEKWIMPPFISQQLAALIAEKQASHLRYFLLADQDIKRLLKSER